MAGWIYERFITFALDVVAVAKVDELELTFSVVADIVSFDVVVNDAVSIALLDSMQKVSTSSVQDDL